MSALTASSRPAARRELASAFDACRAQGRAALVIYTTAGHPEPAQGLDVLVALADAGADVLELGVPFSDPLADGPTIQKSCFEAISQGVDLRWTLELLARFREWRRTPVVIFTYLNPVLDYGLERFLTDATAAGADGVLLLDLPAGADATLEAAVFDSPLDLIRLVAPTTRPERVRAIAEQASGFLYYVSRTGVTGAREALSEGLEEEIRAVRGAGDLPIVVGFGISTPEQAARVGALAEGVAVGSAVVDRLGRDGIGAAAELVRAMRAALGGDAGG